MFTVLEKRFIRNAFLSTISASFLLWYAYSFLFRVSDEVFLMSTAGSISAPALMLAIAICAIFTARAHTIWNKSTRTNEYIDYTSTLDPRVYPGINREHAGVTIHPRVYCWMKRRC